MTTSLTEQFEIQTKNARKKVQKDFWFKQYPSLKNLGIDYERINFISSVELTITDLLNLQEGQLKTCALSTKPVGSSFFIDALQCPICKQTVPLNPLWPVYICNSGQHPKKIYEIKTASQDRIPRFITYEGEDDD